MQQVSLVRTALDGKVRKLKIPTKIKIGGHFLTIKKVKSNELRDSGQYDNWYHIISINGDGTTESRQAEVLLHEIVEAINFKYDLQITHQTISTLSEVLFSVLTDNKLDFTNIKGEKG